MNNSISLKQSLPVLLLVSYSITSSAQDDGIVDRLEKVEKLIKEMSVDLETYKSLIVISQNKCTEIGKQWKAYNPARGNFLLGQGGELPVTGGRSTVNLEIDNLPVHGHPISTAHHGLENVHDGLGGSPADHGINQTFNANAPTTTTFHPSVLPNVVGPTGKGNPHENMPPYVTVHYCVFDG